MSTETIDAIVTFWLGDSLASPENAAARREWWYAGGAPVDEEIRARFAVLVTQACSDELGDWRASPDGALALILLLDQFTRNLYRGTPEAYLGDARAFAIVRHAIELDLDSQLHPVPRIWLYHPFHHSESVDEQDEGLALLREILQAAPAAWHPYVERSISGWTRHRDIVARFGRFPHRNAVLGRQSSDEERAFLDKDGDTFGQ